LLRRKMRQQDLEQEQTRTIGGAGYGGDVAGARRKRCPRAISTCWNTSKNGRRFTQAHGRFLDGGGAGRLQVKAGMPDPAKRQALWEQAKPILAATAGSTEMLDKFDPTNDTQLDAAITTSQSVKRPDRTGQNHLAPAGRTAEFRNR
jgi:hypothetical protein